MKKPRNTDEAMIYELEITLKDANPPILRRVEMPGNFTLFGLHEVIQGVFGWEDCHSHEFIFGRSNRRPTPEERAAAKKNFSGVHELRETSYGDPEHGLDGAKDESDVILSELLKPGETFIYQYDFGDDWIHEIRTEKIKPAQENVEYPVCIGGTGAPPQEDCGGPYGWGDRIDAANDHNHPDHEEHRESLGLKKGKRFDPELFDLAATNRRLKKMLSGELFEDKGADADDDDWKEEPLDEPEKNMPEGRFRLISYKISFEAMKDSEYDLPPDAQAQVKDLYGIIPRNPKKGIAALLQLLEKYPNAARLLNYLGAAYSMAGMHDKARETAEKNFLANPNYLFAKLNYAEIFLRKGDFAKVKEILQDKWELGLHYPKRDTFHITEVLSFLATAARYMIGIEDLENAEKYEALITRIAPDSEEARVVSQSLTNAKVLKAAYRLAHRPAPKPKGKKKPNQ